MYEKKKNSFEILYTMYETYKVEDLLLVSFHCFSKIPALPVERC